MGRACRKSRGIKGESGDNIFNNDLIPNPDDVYEQRIKDWSWQIEADARIHERDFSLTFLNGQTPTVTHDFTWAVDGVFDFEFSIELAKSGGPWADYTGTGSAHVAGITSGSGEPRNFDMEILSLDGISGVLDGITPFMIRESPTLASTGLTTVKSLGGGQYQIDIFFDVFTEMSLDGGQTWAAMVPEPTAALLALFAGMGMVLTMKRCVRE